MNTWLSALIAVIATTGAIAADPPVSASGTLYFVFDAASPAGAQMDGVLFARFIPDDESRSKFPAATIDGRSAPVRYISFEPADEVLTTVVGSAFATQLSHGRDRIVQVPVTLTLRNFHAEGECDSVAYHATFVSAKSLGSPKAADPGRAADNGC
jgi:hypothetical protein